MKKCKYANNCGACAMIKTAYPETLRAKQQQIQELFPKYKVERVLGMENPYHYRHKIYASFGTSKDGKLKAGLYEENSHRIVEAPECLIQHEKANALIQSFVRIAQSLKLSAYDEDTHRGVLRHLYIRVSHSTQKMLLVIVIGSKDLPANKQLVTQLLKENPDIESIVLNFNNENTSMILGSREKVLYGRGYLQDEIGGVKFRISSHSFYQVNPQETEVLYQKAIELAKIDKKTTVLDACCGIGTISLLAAKQAAEVVGVEIVEEAIQDAIHNARRNKISNAQFYCDDANAFLDRLLDDPDVVILDPPRSGMKQDFMVHLAERKIKRVVYVSCNPVTQARDIKNLTSRGYKVEVIQPVDLFPFTKHVETVVLMSRKEK